MYEANFEFLQRNVIEGDFTIQPQIIEADLKLNIVPDKTSQLINDSGYITSADIPTEISAFNNDVGYITENDVGNATIIFTQEGQTIGSLTTNQKTNGTINIGQSGTKVIWRVYD